jgi:hypothetical protein
MKRFFLALLLMALPLAAQEEKKAEAPAPPTVQKLFVLKYADPQEVSNLLRVFHASIVPNRDMRVLAVDAAQSTMAAIEDAIKRLDVPSAAATNVDLTVYLVVGREGESPAGSSALPKDLDSVVTQLKNAFAFKSYSLMDVLALRTRTGQAVSSTSSGGSMPTVQGGPKPVTTAFRVRSTSIGSDGATIHITDLNAHIETPVSTVALGTDIDIKEGQKVVIGRLGISKDEALFLVMTVKILQ